MEIIAVALTIVAGLTLLGFAANAWGADSRDRLPDDHRR